MAAAPSDTVRPSPSAKSPEQQSDHVALGRAGEDCAERFLEGRGHRILERRYRTKTGEIDLITHSGDHIYFVEVKTRRPGSAAYGGGLEAVPPSRQHRMVQTARWYLSAKRLDGVVPHFAVIAIETKGAAAHLRFLPDAFIAHE